MTIKERIAKIKEYFVSMEIKTIDDAEQIIYVLVEFPNGWIIDYDIESKFDVQVLQSAQNSYFFVSDINNGVDVVFDAIEYNIEKMKDAIERAQLLTEKTKELKELFSNENISLNSLRSLTFSYATEAIYVLPSESVAKTDEESSIKDVADPSTNKKKEDAKNINNNISD